MNDYGKWIVNYDNGLKFGMIDLRCPHCDGCVVCPKVDIPNFCGKCGSDNRPRILDEAVDGEGKDGNVKEGGTNEV